MEPTPPSGAAYLDRSLPPAERTRDLVARLTLEEKVARLGSVWVYELLDGLDFSPAKAQQLLGRGIGQITRIGGASALGPQASAQLANTIQTYLREHTRLGIPALVHEECCSGYMARGATCFPQMIGVASSWQPELLEQATEVIRAQMRAVGAHQALAPVLDVTREPRWGRVEETFGEDPYLVASMGVAYICGLQGSDLGCGVMATGKHFLGYGVSEGGMNWAPAHIPARELAEIFLLPFEAAIREANVASIMNAYHELDGEVCGASQALLTDLLRGKLGFDGLVVSDYFAVPMLESYHHVAVDKGDAAIQALTAGIDVELPSTNAYGEPLLAALREGKLDPALIDQALERLLRKKFELGLFDAALVEPTAAPAIFDTPEQRALARKLAQQSIVLLKNAGGLLPLNKQIARLAVIGPNADSVRNLLGDYAYPCHIETLIEQRENPGPLPMPVPESIELVDNFVPIISILQAIRDKVGSATQLTYAQGCAVNDGDTAGFAEAVAAAQASDVAVVVLGDRAGLTDECTTGEARDRADLGLPGQQDALLRAIHATGTPIVLVLVNGRPLALPWASEQVPAILEAWLPGEEGAAAVADVLFGDANPGGRLPISIPQAVGQVPVYYNHKPSGGRSHWKGDYVDLSTRPLYPFGHGLSYTHFVYSGLEIAPTELRPDGQVRISVAVANEGDCAGDEVVQLYLHDPVASVTRPVKELKGFKRLTLAPGQQARITFTVDACQLAFSNRAHELVVETGAIAVMVGGSSEDIRLSGSFMITGEALPVADSDKVFFSKVEVQQ